MWVDLLLIFHEKEVIDVISNFANSKKHLNDKYFVFSKANKLPITSGIVTLQVWENGIEIWK